MRKNTKKCDWSDKIFKEIYEEADGCSMLTGKPVGNLVPIKFAHVLAKGQNKFPEFMYYKKNILLVTAEEHHLFDNGTKGQRKKYAENCREWGLKCHWYILYDLIDELKIEYKKLYNLK